VEGIVRRGRGAGFLLLHTRRHNTNKVNKVQTTPLGILQLLMAASISSLRLRPCVGPEGFVEYATSILLTMNPFRPFCSVLGFCLVFGLTPLLCLGFVACFVAFDTSISGSVAVG
jgi:hypothetical protein